MSSGDSSMFERQGLYLRTRWLAVILIIIVGYLDVSAAELTKIYAGYGGIAGYQLPLWINKEIGISRKYGIDIEPLLVGGGAQTRRPLISPTSFLLGAPSPCPGPISTVFGIF